MKLGYELNLEQTQKLVMTPELRQAIELLQFNILELDNYIQKELEENPMLEPETKGEELESLDAKLEEDINWAEYFEDGSNYGYNRGGGEQEDLNFQSFIQDKPSMRDDLVTQFNILADTKKEIDIGKIIIQNLDEDGYLGVEIDELVKTTPFKRKDLIKVLEKIQKLEPLGIGARNLEECLLLQLKEKNKLTPLIEKVIKGYLEDVAYNRIHKISNELKVDEEEVKAAISEIKKLEPRPAKHLSDEEESTRYIVPDGEIKFVDGEYKVILNEDTAPRLIINNKYKKMLLEGVEGEAKEYLEERLDRALWVIRSIEQRKNTIEKILKSILKFQADFFKDGEKALKPLTMKEVADDIEMHESTVSRVANDKYVQTPRGLYEIKYFFVSGITTSEGEDKSSMSIKAIIKDIIEKEDKEKPYSDQKIANLLKEKGIKISRRTVAKYRNEMDILSSSMRRGV